MRKRERHKDAVVENEPTSDTVSSDTNTAVAAVPWLPPLFHPKFVELSRMMTDLLARTLEDDLSDCAPLFEASQTPANNDMMEVPVLIALLAGLPFINFEAVSQHIIPLVRALLVDEDFNVVGIVKGRAAEDRSFQAIDKLYEHAATTNSRTVADIADYMLYELVIRQQFEGGHHRLVQRFYELYLTLEIEPETLRERIVHLAEAKLKVERLAHGAPANKVLRKNRPDMVPIITQLAAVATEAQQHYSTFVDSWIDFIRSELAELDPKLEGYWQSTGERDISRIHVPWKANRDFHGVNLQLLHALHSDVTELYAYLIEGKSLPLGTEDAAMADTLTDQGNGGELSDIDTLFDDRKPDWVRLGKGRKSKQAERRKPRSYGEDDTQTSKVEDETTENNKADDEAKADSQDIKTLVVLTYLDEKPGNDLRNTLKPYQEALLDKPLPLLPTPDFAPAREHLAHMLPHLEQVIDRILNSMAPHQSLTLPPILLVGAPGCGKTSLLEELVKLLAVPSITVDAAGGSDANFLGVDYRWGTGAAGVHLDLIKQHKIANPVVIIDELEKLGGSARNGDARQKMLGLLEPRRAKAFFDPFLSTAINLSAMSWVFTANTLDDIPAALQNRLEIIRCPSPKRAHLDVLAPQLLMATYKERGLRAEWCQPLTQVEMQTLRRHWPGGSIRDLKRLIRAVIDAREKFMPRA
jgi:inhibitor of KinA sporulation pathway (predicted exonuclease)